MGQISRKYLTEKEAFQNLCWTYHGFTKKCLQNCRNDSLKRWLDKVFFTPLNKYCVEFYDDIISNWNCIRKLKKYRRLCDRECAGTCDPTCLYFCYRPVSRRICKTEISAKILLEVSELKSPQQNSIPRHQPICIKEPITNYSNIKAQKIN
uniref:Uncharacterized protein n=1 Tax=Panagrolaimus sp. PS1159 TaxID=55785 RepID=A0AC35F5Q3_9BILA